MTLRLEIVTPEITAYSENVEMVTLPGSEGDLGVYPKHVPLLTILKPGELRVVKNGRATSLAVGEVFIEITADRVSILTDMALGSEQDRKSTRLNSSHVSISYAVFCLQKKKK